MPKVIAGRQVKGFSVEGRPDVVGEAKIFYLTSSGDWTSDKRGARRFPDEPPDGEIGDLQLEIARIRAEAEQKYTVWPEEA